MKALPTCLLPAFIAIFLACGNLTAGSMTIGDLPDPNDIDTLNIQLGPANGAVDGVAGATVGWGFTVSWSSTNGDVISFSGTSVTPFESNPSLRAGYMSFIDLQGGPDSPGVLAPADGPWTEAFDPGSQPQQGVGSYRIASDPAIAVPGAQDTGQISFSFSVYDSNLNSIGDPSYTYSDASTAYTVTVDASSAPEPATLGLLLVGLGILATAGRQRVMPAARDR
jgi:hypothetical protein